MPSNRRFAEAAASIDSAIAYVEARGYHLVVSDNSGDPEKAAHYRDRSDHMTYLVNPGLVPTANLLATLDAARSAFVLPMGDDDLLTAVAGEAPFDFASINDDVVGVRPVLDVWAAGEGVLRRDTFAIEGEGPLDRIQDYARKFTGDNVLYYAMYRAKHLREIIDLIDRFHPTSRGDLDWAIVYSLLMAGRVLVDPSTIYRYDIGRWRRTAGIEAAVKGFYRDAGFGEAALPFAPMFHFMDCYALAFRPSLALGEVARIKGLYGFAMIYLGPLLRRSEREPQVFAGIEPALAGIRAALAQPDDYLTNVYEACAIASEQLKPGLAAGAMQWLAAVHDPDKASRTIPI
jgi:hypothetical protein